MADAVTTIDEYIAQFSGTARERLVEMRRIVAAAAPEATERISWAMPTFYLDGNVVHFAAAARHIGLYPGADGVSHFLPRLEAYRTSKGAIQFPLTEELPADLIAEIVTFRAEQNVARAKEKQAAKGKNA